MRSASCRVFPRLDQGLWAGSGAGLGVEEAVRARSRRAVGADRVGAVGAGGAGSSGGFEAGEQGRMMSAWGSKGLTSLSLAAGTGSPGRTRCSVWVMIRSIRG
jgi:hypothetical protein